MTATTVQPARARRLAAVVGLVRELRRRAALAHRPQPEGVVRPPLRLLLAEAASGVESWRAWRRTAAPAAPAAVGRAVMLLPGFATHPVRMRRLRGGLEAAGHRVADWGLGWNLGATPARLARLADAVVAMALREGEPVVLVGWSLGGIYAREVARLHPDAVGLVVTMGTPFSGDRHANNAWRAYHWVTGHDVADPPIPGDTAAKPPVRTVALWSPRDGIVSPRAARGRAGERDAAIMLRCTHLGFAHHPGVVAAVLRLLDGPDA